MVRPYNGSALLLVHPNQPIILSSILLQKDNYYENGGKENSIDIFAKNVQKCTNTGNSANNMLLHILMCKIETYCQPLTNVN